MAKAGRKRKTGPRYPCGKIVPAGVVARLNAMAVEKEAEQKVVVLAQPHRLGNTDQKCASAVGRFVLVHYSDKQDGEVFYNAAQEYAALVHRWRAAWGAPMENSMGEGGGGDGPLMSTARGWWDKISDIDTRLAEIGMLKPVKRMVVEDREQVFLDPMRVKQGLWIIAAELGRIDPKRHPFH